MNALKVIVFISFLVPFAVFTQYKVKKLDDLPKKMYETSGVIWYGDKHIITHNDGGNKSEIFILKEDGDYSKTINIKDTKNEDWEDIAQDDKGNVYIGDVGNNLNKRKDLAIYKIEKGFIKKDGVTPTKISFHYPGQKKFPPSEANLNYDCESMIWKDGFIYLFTKCRTKPFTGKSRVYRVPDVPGDYAAEFIGTMQLCDKSWRSCSLTAADYYPKTNMLLLLTYTRLYIVQDFPGAEFWKGKMKVVDFAFIKQREAICVKNDKKFLMTDEHHQKLGGGNIYEIDY